MRFKHTSRILINTYSLGPGPSGIPSHYNSKIIKCRFRSNLVMNEEMSENSDSISMNGDLYNIALGSDLDGLSDNGRKMVSDISSDTDDEVNVTIKQGIKPNYNVVPTSGKVASSLRDCYSRNH